MSGGEKFNDDGGGGHSGALKKPPISPHVYNLTEVKDVSEYCKQLSKISYPKPANSFFEEENQTAYYGGVKAPTTSYFAKMKFITEDLKDAFDGDKTELAKMILGYKPIMTDMGRRIDENSIIPVKVIVKSKEQKEKLVAANGAKLLFEGTNYTIHAESMEKLNRFKGFVSSPQIRYWTEAQIIKEVKKVMPETFVEKDLDIFKKKDLKTGELKPTGTFTILFGDNQQRKKITLGHYVINVSEFEEPPQMCKNCLQLGHYKKICHNPTACFNCGQEGHKATECKEIRCVNCEGRDHKSTDRNCPMYIFMKNTESYCRKYDVSKKYAMKFATDTTTKFFEELRENVQPGTNLPTYSAALKMKWKDTFTTEAEKKIKTVKELLSEKKKREEGKKTEHETKAVTKNLLSSIFQHITSRRPRFSREEPIQNKQSMNKRLENARNEENQDEGEAMRQTPHVEKKVDRASAVQDVSNSDSEKPEDDEEMEMTDETYAERLSSSEEEIAAKKLRKNGTKSAIATAHEKKNKKSRKGPKAQQPSPVLHIK